MSIEWRSKIDIGEEQRFGHQYDPNRVTAVMTVPCASPNCQRPGEEITVVQFADGRRSFQPVGTREVLGKGMYHWSCPDVREDDLRHDAEGERDDA